MIENLKKAILISNYYENFRAESPQKIKSYLRTIGLTAIDVFSIREMIHNEICYIQDLQNAQPYSNKIESAEGDDESDRKTNIEIIIGRELIDKVSQENHEWLNRAPAEVMHNLDIASKVAYKYQLKYSLLVFDVMADDDEIWEEFTIH